MKIVWMKQSNGIGIHIHVLWGLEITSGVLRRLYLGAFSLLFQTQTDIHVIVAESNCSNAFLLQ